MDGVRAAFLEAAAGATSILGRAEVAEHWREVSVLPEFSISGLAGHLLRGIKTVDTYLDGPDPEGASMSAAQYYDSLALTADVSSPLNRAIRTRGEDEASIGCRAVAAEAVALLNRLSVRLPAEAPGRRLQVLDGLVITLDEYLRTRIVELVLHSEDLALSVDLFDAPEVAPTVATVAIETLVDLARLRHGDWAVMRALARRERDSVNALRVL